MRMTWPCKTFRAYFSDGSEFVLPQAWQPQFERFYEGQNFTHVRREILDEVDRIFGLIRRGSRTKASVCEEVVARKIKGLRD